MPCNCDHLEPTRREVASKEAAQNLLYAQSALGTETPEWVTAAAIHVYGNQERADELFSMLCDICKKLDEQDSLILYNGKDWQARQLANWWEAHQAADTKRLAKEEAGRKRLAAASRGRAKLTKEEREALGLA